MPELKTLIILAVGLFIVAVMGALYSGMLRIPEGMQRTWIFGVFQHFDSGSLRVVWSNYQVLQFFIWKRNKEKSMFPNLSVYLTFLQIVNSVVVSLGIAMPNPYSKMLSAFSIFSLDFLPLSCAPHSNYFNETYFWSAIPPLSAILVVLYFASSAACMFIGGLSINRSHLQRHLFDRCITYILFLTYLVLPPISLKQYQGLECQTILGERFLRIDTSINCDSDAYQQFRLINVLCIAIYSAIPPTWLYLLWKQRRLLNPPTSDVRLAYHLRDSNQQLAPLRFLFDAYQPRFYYFEAVEM